MTINTDAKTLETLTTRQQEHHQVEEEEVEVEEEVEEEEADSTNSNSYINNNYYYHPCFVCIVAICVKILLLPSYKSTDFDVHRNWLALTRHVRPYSQWYIDDFYGQTKHTLDYPPLFAFFEYFLSTLFPWTDYLLHKGYISPLCLSQLSDLQNNVDFYTCVVFHRCTVIFIGDLIFWIGTWFFASSLSSSSSSKTSTTIIITTIRSKLCRNKIFAFMILNPGLFLLDHIHFQYNGMLLGILFLSLTCFIRGQQEQEEKNKMHVIYWDLFGAIFYILLLSMKHLYLILAPFYFCYLLRHFCFLLLPSSSSSSNSSSSSLSLLESKNTISQVINQNSTTRTAFYFSWKRFFLLAFITLITFLLPLIPFIITITSTENNTSINDTFSTTTRTLSNNIVDNTLLLQHEYFIPISNTTQVIVSFSPLIDIGKRLFPFQRGLCHTYWAGNIWAIYLFSNKVFTYLWNFYWVKVVVTTTKTSSIMAISTSTSILPTIPPWFCAICLFISLIPGMICAWKVATYSLVLVKQQEQQHDNDDDYNNNKKRINKNIQKETSSSSFSTTTTTTLSLNHTTLSLIFLEGILYSSFCGFMLSYHVHEKAIMTCILPMTCMAFVISTCSSDTNHSLNIRQRFFRLAVYGHFGLLPLLYQSTEGLLKVGFYFVYLILWMYEWQDDWILSWKNSMNVIALCSTSSTLIFTEVLYPILCKVDSRFQKWEFLPLMMTSIVCAIGLIHSWIESGWKVKQDLQTISVDIIMNQ